MIPEPGSMNPDGEPIDLLKNLRAKKELAETLVPWLIEEIQEKVWLASDQDERDTAEHALSEMRKIAKLFGIDEAGL